ncbi:DMT family transporter [Salinarimonas soli]|uniref:DMT family transporter n=1 Tax=Salinarimonas soli TaxID=1638099 RepID=A0A5B2VER8_9HYPH|nr:DMT family transporter [Salinarimonas soli]KAA2236687.1 DMT family transporter [Salinarimonas soli]
MPRSTSATAATGPWSQPYLLLTLTALMWGGNAVAGRLAVGEVSPMALTALRWLIAVAVLAVVARRDLVEAWPVLRPRWASLALFGTMGFTAFNALFYVAAHHTAAVNLGIIQGAIPVVVLLGALVAFRTPIRGVQVLGVMLTLVGVAVVAARGDPRVLATLAVNAGDLYMLLASVLYALYTLALRNRPPVSGLALFAAMALAACLSSLPLVAYEAWSGAFHWPTPKGWLILVYIGLFPSLLSQILFIRGVELIGPGRAGLFVNLVPVFAAILAVGILGEPFRWYHGLALTLVLGGIWLAEQRRR